MESKPFFSVIIPTYNRENLLPGAIESVISQSYTNFELIIIDNGSSDKTEEKVLSFSDSRINYFWQEGSGGPANPRNVGISRSSGEWIAFLDSDDRWLPKKLERVYELINSKQDIDVVCHYEIQKHKISGESKILTHGPLASDMYRSMLLYGNKLSPSATTIRRSLLNSKNEFRFNESANYTIVEDFDLWLRLAKHGARFHFIEEPLSQYIIGDNLISNLELYCRNLSTLYHDHAFHLQDFETDKDKLWKRLQAQVEVIKAKDALKSINLLRVVLSLNKILFTAPLLLLEKIKKSKRVLALR